MLNLLLLSLATNPLSLQVKVDGSGFLRFAHATQVFYASEAKLIVREGVLQTADGYVLIPRIHVTPESTKLSVKLDGEVFAETTRGSEELGQLVLTVLPQAPGQTGMFRSTTRGTLANPGEDLAGVIRNSSAIPKQSASRAVEPDVDTPLMKIVVSKFSEIENDSITLGDIAKFTGPRDRRADAQQVDLGRMPELGRSLHLSEGFIATRLKLAGFKPDDFVLIVPEETTVTRPTQTITQEQLSEAAMTSIKQNYDVTVDLKPDSRVPELKVPKGDLELSTSIYTKTDRSISVMVTAVVNGIRAGGRSFTMVAADDAVGVRVGDRVTIRLISAGATVEVPGHVTSAGWVGQMVSVTAETGSMHSAKVISSNLVEVRL